jgi:hypothetical protein
MVELRARRRAVPPLAACVLIAAASVPIASALNYDAWGWLMWGRELVGRLPFTTSGYPSWKPLTGLIAIPLAPLGDAGVTMWLILARAGALAALWLAYRLGRRAAGPWAGMLAPLALLLVPGWLLQAGVGGSEPLLTAFLLGALDRHLAGADDNGLLLTFLAALLRPEAWPALLISAALAWRRRELRPFACAALLAVPALWFGGEYLGSGDPFTGGRMARMSKEALALRRSTELPSLVVLERAAEMLPVPVLLGLPVALVAGWRRRDPLLLALCAAALVWTAEVAAMAAFGYAGLARFMYPAAAAGAIAGIAGLTQLVRAAGSVPARAALVGLALAASVLFSAGSVAGLASQAVAVEQRSDLEQNLIQILARVGPRPFGTARHVSAQGIEATALAWRLGVLAGPLRHARVPGLALALRHESWPRFRRALRRREGQLATRTLARGPALTLLSVSPVPSTRDGLRRR